MQTIGQILRNARVAKSYSFKDLENITKIKSSFIEAIENEKWEALPALPVVSGFVKSLSSPLDLNEKLTTAVLKRDYPPRKLRINPKPDVEPKMIWGPKMTFWLSASLIVLALIGYLGFQYYKFISPPGLTVDSPKQNQVVSNGEVLVFGSTDSDAKITVNNQPVIVGDDGKFSVDISVVADTKEVDVTATDRSGKSTTIRRTIVTAQR